jgi:predicted HD phosphohydrolase
MNFIRNLFKRFGQDIYIGENISQIQHMSQTARFAEMAGSNDKIIVGAFLHDIGHFLHPRHSPRMEYDGKDLGVLNHELVGEQFCIKAGLPTLTCNIVRNHVNAKRYLVSDPKYLSKLSKASYETLKLQGDVMSEKEKQYFEKDPYFQTYINIRKWEEQAKDPNIIISEYDIDRYFKMGEILIERQYLQIPPIF